MRVKTVSIKCVRHHGQMRWRVRFWQDGRMRRRFFGSKGKAEAEAAARRGAALSVDEQWFAMEQAEREELLMVRRLARERGFNLLGLVHGTAAIGKSVSAATAKTELEKIKSGARRSKPYVASLKYVVGDFIQGRDTLLVNQFTVDDVKEFLDERSLAGRSTRRARLATFFKFCVRKKWRTDNPCNELESVKIPRRTPAILTLEELRAALKWLQAHPRALGWFALTTFAALRPMEAMQTRWADIHFDEGWIRVEAQSSKVGLRRVVYPFKRLPIANCRLPISKASKCPAMLWLRLAKKLKAQLPLTRKQLVNEIKGLRAALGWKAWKQDVTRHSAASAWVMVAEDLPALARQMGTSEKKLRENYLAVFTKSQAEKFWAILPDAKHKNSKAEIKAFEIAEAEEDFEGLNENMRTTTAIHSQ